jgi:hypothetical protein
MSASQPFLEVLSTPAAGRLPDLLEDEDEDQQLVASNTLFGKQSSSNELEQ